MTETPLISLRPGYHPSAPNNKTDRLSAAYAGFDAAEAILQMMNSSHKCKLHIENGRITVTCGNTGREYHEEISVFYKREGDYIMELDDESELYLCT